MAGKKKGKLPKRIAGVKVPKALRNPGKTLSELTQNPLAREICAAGLVAAAAAIAKDKRVQQAAGKTGEGAREGVATASDTAARVGQALVAAITSAAGRIHAEHDDRKPATPGENKVARPADKVRKKDRPVAAS